MGEAFQAHAHLRGYGMGAATRARGQVAVRVHRAPGVDVGACIQEELGRGQTLVVHRHVQRRVFLCASGGPVGGKAAERGNSGANAVFLCPESRVARQKCHYDKGGCRLTVAGAGQAVLP
jgi:hypothetical protein